MPRPKKLITSSFQFYLDERMFYYLKLSDGEEFTLEDLQEVRRFIEEEHDSKKRPFLVELAYGSTVSDGVQEHMAYAADRYSTADALLISTFAHKLIAKFYLRHFKPTRPTKVFQDVFEALDWIEKEAQKEDQE
jgi:hypothetical protein